MIIRSLNNQKEFPEGTTVRNCLVGLDAFPRGTLAALSGGIVRELNDPLRHDCTLTPLTLEHEEGRRIYERSLRFVMLLALRHLYPYKQVRIEYSVGYGVFVRLPEVELHRQDIVRIENEMRRIVELDLEFTRKVWTREDAIEYFREARQPDKVELLSRRVPTVLIGEKQSGLGICSIELSNILAGSMLARHLISLGHRKMVFISTPPGQLTLARGQRLDGIRQQLEETGLKDSLEVLAAEPSRETDRQEDMPYEYSVGRQLTAGLLDRGTDATALIGVNDMTALGILDELHARGLRAPENYSVCGFDNIFPSRLEALGLTTIDHRMSLRCREAVNMILAQRSGNPLPAPHKIEYAPQLVIRRTTGPVPHPAGSP